MLVLRRSARRDRGLLPLAAGGRGRFRGGVQSVPEEHGLRRQEAQAGQPITARSVAALGEIEIEAEQFRGSVTRRSRLAVADGGGVVVLRDRLCVLPQDCLLDWEQLKESFHTEVDKLSK